VKINAKENFLQLVEECRPKYQILRLVCLVCDHRFRKRVCENRTASGGAKRLEQLVLVRCPSCGSGRFDTDPDQPAGKLGAEIARARRLAVKRWSASAPKTPEVLTWGGDGWVKAEPKAAG